MSAQVIVIKRRSSTPDKPTDPRRFTRPPTLGEIAVYAKTMKERARRMRGVESHNPHAFHEDKSDMARAWEKLEDAIRNGTLLLIEAQS